MSDPENRPQTVSLNRRALILAAVTGGVVWLGWPRISRLFVGSFDFVNVDTLPGFRRLPGGEISGFANPLIGLEVPETEDLSVEMRAARSDMCRALFGAVPKAGVVPIASFSDYNCPYCRVLTGILTDLEARSGGDVRVTWHEWPLLGPTSVLPARAALAAELQGAYAAFHKRLMRARFVPTDRYIALMAEDIGANPERLLADMYSADVETRLRNTAAVARIFGFAGTPALIVGRTVVVGSISEATLYALIEQEHRDGTPPVCKV